MRHMLSFVRDRAGLSFIEDACKCVLELRQMVIWFWDMCVRDLPITPVLSPLMMMRVSCTFAETIQRMASLSAMDSAHLMSRPSVFQPGVSCQAAHALPTTMPIPHEVETSTHMSRSMVWRVVRECEPNGLDNSSCHQSKS